MKTNGKNTTLKTNLKSDTNIYPVSEDTILMNKAIKILEKKTKLKGKEVIEIGCGNCYNAIYLAKKGAIVDAIDINENAIKFCKRQAEKEKVKINVWKSNMFSKINKKYDLIIFNPPYLPSEKIEDVRIDGLKEGRFFIDIFIKEFDKYLKKDGKALLLHTNYNNLKKTEKKLKEKKYKIKIIATQHLFFEELFVLLIEKAKVF